MSHLPTKRQIENSAGIPSFVAAYEKLAQAYIAIVNNEAGAVERYQIAFDRLEALRGDA